MNTQKFIADLKSITRPDIKWNRETKTHDDIVVSPSVFERDGRIIVSAEDGRMFADYYGEFRDGYAWIDDKLVAVAAKHGMRWEWENPGCIMAVEA